MHRVGSIDIGSYDTVARNARIAADAGVEYEMLSSDEINSKWPQFAVPPDLCVPVCLPGSFRSR